MTLEENEKLRLGRVAWSQFEHAVENIPERLRNGFLKSCFIEVAQKTVLMNCFGDKAVLAKELSDIIEDYIRQHQ